MREREQTMKKVECDFFINLCYLDFSKTFSTSLMFGKKRFYNRVLNPFIRISQLLAEVPSTLSWVIEIIEFRKGLIIWISEGKGVWKTFAALLILNHPIQRKNRMNPW